MLEPETIIGQRQEDWIAEKASELRAKATYIDMIDAIDSAAANLGRPFEVELENVLRGNDKLAIGSLIDFALRRYFRRAVE
jgi:hypothetical protein